MKPVFILRGPDDINRLERTGPTLEEVLLAVKSLDGEKRSGIILKSLNTGAAYLGIAGGAGGQFVVFLAVDGAWTKHAVNPRIPAGQDERKMVCGGQRSEMDVHFLIGEDQTVKAVEHFYMYQSECPDLVWESM